MHQIQLSDELFQTAQQRALEFGYTNVEEYVAAMIREEPEPIPNLDHLFTPERMAIIDRAAAEFDAGKGMTMEDLDRRLAAVRAAWKESQSNK